MASLVLQTPLRAGILHVELWLERERDQLPLWLPVALGGGISVWFMLPVAQLWQSFILFGLALALSGPLFGWPQRLGRTVFWLGLTIALGCGLAWFRSEWVRHDVLARPLVTQIEGRILRVEDRVAEDRIRLVLRQDAKNLPGLIRVTIKTEGKTLSFRTGMKVRLKARIAPPPKAALPGGYDFSRAAWFMGLGAVGQVQGEVIIVAPGPTRDGLRQRLSEHVRSRILGSEGGIAAAFASGDRGGISIEDEEAMRASGLTHLLSISGLHVTAVVAAALYLTLRLLALSPWLALRLPLLVIAAGVGAGAGIGYTLLTGAEVPTVRSCVAAMLVMLGMALGREALTLRLVATGAIFVLLLWPDALMGASFQLSFAAITSIVAFHEQKSVKAFLARREEAWVKRAGRSVIGLLLTGLVVEVVLSPIALFHFHKSGVFGALANMVAIPLTTFVVMPLEAIALLLDVIGLGGPFWWLTGQALSFLLWIAREVAAWPGAVALVPTVSLTAFACMIGGGLWFLLWSSKVRVAGLVPVLVGIALVAGEARPDILITDDGRHMAVRRGDGQMALLREKTGDFVRDVMAERAGVFDVDALIDDSQGAQCSLELCTVTVSRAGRHWTIGATRSQHLVRWSDLISLCPKLDIILSERILPTACHPKWLKVDRPFLAKTGGLAITFGDVPLVETTKGGRDDHPWTQQTSFAPRKRRPDQ